MKFDIIFVLSGSLRFFATKNNRPETISTLFVANLIEVTNGKYYTFVKSYAFAIRFFCYLELRDKLKGQKTWPQKDEEGKEKALEGLICISKIPDIIYPKH